jgi:signal transduction histidine kinase
MQHFMRRSLLVQLLSVYLLFVVLVLVAGVVVNAVVEQQLSNDAQASDQALAQEVAVVTSLGLSDAKNSIFELSTVVGQANTLTSIVSTLQAFKAARSDVDQVYWLDTVGILQASCSQKKCQSGFNTFNTQEFSPPTVVQAAISKANHPASPTSPVFEVGLATVGLPADLKPNKNIYSAGVIVAQAAHDKGGKWVGIVAANFSLAGLSEPLRSVVQTQHRQNRRLVISVIDDQGRLIASPYIDQESLWNVLNELPGADQALQGHVASRQGISPDGQDWLYSAVPVPGANWAVVVQRRASEALAIVAQFHLWLLFAALLFAIGGLLFWLMLLMRVIRPLHTLAIEHQALPTSEQSIPADTAELVGRDDEVGNLARSLLRLERDGLEKLGELRTLLETSNAVVGSLEPRAVVSQIIREVQRLVDVQAAALLLPDEQGVLRVLVSDGHSEHYDHVLSLSPEKVSSAPVLALRDGKPVQKLLGPGQQSFSYDEGFRTVLAIPIISRHAGAVVLLVHRTEPRPFNQNEINLLLTFANYATLAWEHAILYERSDVRLREEKQKLEAIMGSMSDGLVLTDIDGTVLYANLGASAIAGLPNAALERRPISTLYDALRAAAVDPANCEQALARVESAEATELIVEIKRSNQRHAIHLRLFDVGDESGQAIGRGLLLRDITRERELDEFKSALLAAVGHELRTPLAAIKGHASTLLQKDVTWPPADQRHFLQTISSEADRLAQLVSNLLDLSRQEAGLLLLNREPTRVHDLVAKTIQRLGLSNVAISLQIPDDLPLVNVDAARIEVVLHNLIANALVYGEGEVAITAERRNDVIVISVSDTGPGIAPDELPHVFERFYRAGYGRQQHSGGTGLGLTICKAFVEAHKSAIWAKSSASGTTISFSLPLVSPAVTAPLEHIERTELSAVEGSRS